MSTSFPVPGATVIEPTQGHTYTIGPFIGNGSFGAVFECTENFGSPLVAKVLFAEGCSYDELHRRWRQESTNLYSLRHPNITYVYDAFESNGSFYLITERCMTSLTSLLAWDGFEGVRWLPAIARCLLRALHFIHRWGWVHKDLHAGNVLTALSFDEMVPQKAPVWTFKIADLGISNLIQNVDLFNTRLAQWMLPPEFYDSVQFGQFNTTLDIYDAGLLFLGILARPLPSFTPEQIVAGVPRKIAEGLSAPYGPAIARALRRHVARRTPTALAFWQDLNAPRP